MKRILLLVLPAVLLLGGCGNTAAMDSLIEAQAETYAVFTDPPVPTAPPVPEVTVPDSQNGEYDVDLTILESSMVYAQCYDMVYNPDVYTGKTVRVKGPFAYYQDEKTNKEYFAVLISDATACCSQGIEFVLEGEHVYPEDYPAESDEITVVGTYNCYEEDGSPYVQLLNAHIEA